MKEETKEEAKALAALTEAQINVLYTRGLIDRATWNNALRSFRGDSSQVAQHALKTCEVAIEALVERALDAACAVIQEKLAVKTGDLAAATLSDGTIERELIRYVHVELAELSMAEADAPANEEAGQLPAIANTLQLIDAPPIEPPKKWWNGMCPAGKHGLDFEGQRCDLCSEAPPVSGEETP